MGLAIKLFTAGLIIKSITGLFGAYTCNNLIRENLESDAVLCSLLHNLTPLIKEITLPIEQNRDLDGNGKCESALFYEDSTGKIVYQKRIKDKYGNLSFLEPKNYEKGRLYPLQMGLDALEKIPKFW